MKIESVLADENITSEVNELVNVKFLNQNEIYGSNTTPKTPSVPQQKSSVDNRVFIEDVGDEHETIDQPRRGTKRRLCYPGDVDDNENHHKNSLEI